MLELLRAVQDFNEVVDDTIATHELAPDTFKWITGEVQHPMKPQPILAPGPIMVSPWYVEAIDLDHFTSTVTVYGGKVLNHEGNFGFGYTSGHIRERTPPGVKHQSNSYDPPVPYITRLLTIKNGVVSVRTPEKDKPKKQGPVVFEGWNRRGRWATETSYDPHSQMLSVREGNFITDGQGWSNDCTTSRDASQLPRAIVDVRIAVMVNTLKSAADILKRVIAKDTEHVKWRVE